MPCYHIQCSCVFHGNTGSFCAENFKKFDDNLQYLCESRNSITTSTLTTPNTLKYIPHYTFAHLGTFARANLVQKLAVWFPDPSLHLKAEGLGQVGKHQQEGSGE